MPSWKLWFRRGITAVILLIVLAAALCAAGLVPYLLSVWSTSMLLLSLSASLAFALVTWDGAWLDAMSWRTYERAYECEGSSDSAPGEA
jgi:hypothetical protein